MYIVDILRLYVFGSDTDACLMSFCGGRVGCVLDRETSFELIISCFRTGLLLGYGILQCYNVL